MDDSVESRRANRPLRTVKITKSRKPDILTIGGKHYFIHGVMRVEGFDHMTPMTEEETEMFLVDLANMPHDELHMKWGRFAVDDNEENNLKLDGAEGVQDVVTVTR